MGHYERAVSTLTRVLEEAFTKASYDMEDFLDHTYFTLFSNYVLRNAQCRPRIVKDLFTTAGTVQEVQTTLQFSRFAYDSRHFNL